MPFYLFGTYNQLHIDHLLLRSPNAQITTSVKFDIDFEGYYYVPQSSALVAVFDTVNEWAMQPISTLPKASSGSNIFYPGEKYAVTVYEPIKRTEGPGLIQNLGYPIARGTITLGDAIYIDATVVNEDPQLNPVLGAETVLGWEDTWKRLMESRFSASPPPTDGQVKELEVKA